MIISKKEFINILPIFYNQFHLPIFLLSDDLSIIKSTQAFLELENNYFQKIISPQYIHEAKIYTHIEKEAFFFFHYPIEDIEYVCIGPFYNRKMNNQDHPSDYPFTKHITSSFTIEDFMNLPYLSSPTINTIIDTYQIITGQTIKREEVKTDVLDFNSQPLKQEDTLNEVLFQTRENPIHSFKYDYEKRMINAIQNENTNLARLLMVELAHISNDNQLSLDNLQSMKYKFVATIALMTRAAIEVGVSISKAYNLSDIYILKADHCQTIDEIYNNANDSIIDFVRLIKRYRHAQDPYWLKTCKNYISFHLHQKINLAELAEIVDMNPCYLSNQFKKLTGESLKHYINKSKITEAQFLIKHSHYSLLEISDILQFSSQSHFQKVFKDIIGMSPTNYKNKT